MFPITVKRLGMAALLGLVPALALATPPQGNWRGLIQQANTDVAVDLRFNAQDVQVHFDEPLSCTAPGKLLKEEGGSVMYRFGVAKNGGRFCEGLQGRDLTLTAGDKARLTLSFTTAKATWQGHVDPQPTTTP